MKVSRAQKATLLAALRYYQHGGQDEPSNRADDIHDIATDHGHVTSLDNAGIDDLCEFVNCYL